MSDIVKLYNPANAAALTPEQLTGLQQLTSTEIKELATAYPNMTMQRAYLLIIDKTKPAEKQLPTLSSFENLWNLREKNGLRNYVAYAFKGVYKSVPSKSLRPQKQEVLDLSETELLSLPGFKTATTKSANFQNLPPADNKLKISEPVTVKVTKIKKSAKPKSK